MQTPRLIPSISKHVFGNPPIDEVTLKDGRNRTRSYLCYFRDGKAVTVFGNVQRWGFLRNGRLEHRNRQQMRPADSKKGERALIIDVQPNEYFPSNTQLYYVYKTRPGVAKWLPDLIAAVDRARKEEFMQFSRVVAGAVMGALPNTAAAATREIRAARQASRALGTPMAEEGMQ